MKTVISADPPVNQAPPELDPTRDLPRGFYDFLLPLHRAFTPRQRELAGAEPAVKMRNSGAPGVMLDLEDSVANAWPNINQGVRNIIAALRGDLTYQDRKRGREVAINESKTVILMRPRGLHLEQAGLIKGERMAAALFDVAMVAYQVDPGRLKHPFSIYIAKSESADEALWWRDLFQAISAARGWPSDYIKCM